MKIEEGQNVQSNRMHAYQRAKKHYKIELTDNSINEIVRKIQSKEAEHLYRLSKRRTIWKVDVNNRKIIVIYSSSFHGIVTVLPSECESKIRRDYIPMGTSKGVVVKEKTEPLRTCLWDMLSSKPLVYQR